MRRYLIGFITGLLVVVGITNASTSSGTIGQLFSLLTGSENGVFVTNQYRLEGKNIKDGTISTYEIEDESIESRDLGVNSVGDSELIDNPSVSSLKIIGGDQRIVGDNDSYIGLESNNSSTVQLGLKDKEDELYGRVYGSGNGSYFGLIDKNNQWILQSSVNNFVRFLVGGVEKMRILSNGNVGIGTSNPSEKLEVNGNIIAGIPTANNHVATKQYVDQKVVGIINSGSCSPRTISVSDSDGTAARCSFSLPAANNYQVVHNSHWRGMATSGEVFYQCYNGSWIELKSSCNSGGGR